MYLNTESWNLNRLFWLFLEQKVSMVCKSDCVFQKFLFFCCFYPFWCVFVGNFSSSTFSFLHAQSGRRAYCTCITQWDSLALNLQLILTTVISFCRRHFSHLAWWKQHSTSPFPWVQHPLPFQSTQGWSTPPDTAALPWHGFLRIFWVPQASENL